MQRVSQMIILLSSTFALSACQFFAPGMGEQTLVAQNESLNTEIAAVRQTATVDADRLMITLEHAQTQIRTVNEQTGQLSATLVAAGTPATGINLNAITPQFAPPNAAEPGAAGAAPPPANPLQLTTPLAPTPVPITPGLGAAGDPGGGGAAPNTTPNPNQPSVTNITVAPQVGPDDCAVNPTTSFTVNDSAIYVVATANNITPGTTISTDWLVNGALAINYDWTPDFEINGACIWFFIDQTEVEFTPGNWQVQFNINGTPQGQPATFSIIGQQGGGDTMQDEGG